MFILNNIIKHHVLCISWYWQMIHEFFGSNLFNRHNNQCWLVKQGIIFTHRYQCSTDSAYKVAETEIIWRESNKYRLKPFLLLHTDYRYSFQYTHKLQQGLIGMIVSSVGSRMYRHTPTRECWACKSWNLCDSWDLNGGSLNPISFLITVPSTIIPISLLMTDTCIASFFCKTLKEYFSCNFECLEIKNKAYIKE